MKKSIAVLFVLVLSVSLLAGCVRIALPSVDPTNPAPNPPATELPATDATETAEATEATEAASDACFEIIPEDGCNHYTNGSVDVVYRMDTGSVVKVYLAAGTEEPLFTVAPSDDVLCAMIGVTNDRLYFGWNEVEDWWGLNVYSVDWQGQDRQEFGSAWDPFFEEGWLRLMGFRTDVSSTELLLINYNDEIVYEDTDLGAVWDAVVLDGSVYFVTVEDLGPEPWSAPAREGGWNYDLFRADVDGTITLLKVFEGQQNFYTAAFFIGDVLCIYESDLFFNVRTMEPTTDPVSDTPT